MKKLFIRRWNFIDITGLAMLSSFISDGYWISGLIVCFILIVISIVGEEKYKIIKDIA